MEPFIKHTGKIVPLDQPNIDTDQIIPKQFLKRVERTGFGEFLFYDWRYLPNGDLDTSFVLNQPRYQGATILLAGRNFGCGSSREHAPWSLLDYSFRAIIAPSFADIFVSNCFQNGIVPVALSEAEVAAIMRRAEELTDYRVTINLQTRTVSDTGGFKASFAIDDFRRDCLMKGLDDIGLTLQYTPQLAAYEARRPAWQEISGGNKAAQIAPLLTGNELIMTEPDKRKGITNPATHKARPSTAAFNDFYFARAQEAGESRFTHEHQKKASAHAAHAAPAHNPSK
ncbi:MAG: 3-isopropylmalate dehydratase small subunit [Pyrinomonadaceae bacterium]